MTVIIDIIIRDIKQVMRSPVQISLLVLFPLALVGFFAFMYGGNDVGTLGNSFDIAILNQDEIDIEYQNNFTSMSLPSNIFDIGFGELFVDSLEHNSDFNITNTFFTARFYDTEDELRNSVKSQVTSIGIIIPINFSQSILTGINNKNFLTEGEYLVNDILYINTNSTLTVVGESNGQIFQNVQTEINLALEQFKESFYDIGLSAGQFNIINIPLSSNTTSDFDYFLPGFIIFGLLLGISNISHIIGNERLTGTLERIKISNITNSEYLIGLILAQCIMLTIQSSVMIISAYMFGFNGLGNPFYAIIICVLTVIPTLGLGLLISSIDKTGSNASGISAILSTPLGFLSGAFIPLPSIPLIKNIIPNLGEFRDLEFWDLFPFNNSVMANRKILLLQYDLVEVLPEIILLLISGTILLILGIISFSRVINQD